MMWRKRIMASSIQNHTVQIAPSVACKHIRLDSLADAHACSLALDRTEDSLRSITMLSSSRDLNDGSLPQATRVVVKARINCEQNASIVSGVGRSLSQSR